MTSNATGRRVAFVTGASRGIGRSAAIALAERGYSLLLTARDAEALSETAARIEALGGTATTVAADLETEGGRERIGVAIDRLQRLDVAVHAAGLFLGGPGTVQAERFAHAFAVHCTAPAILTERARVKLQTARGLVIFVSSTQAIRPSAGAGVYAASKAALGAYAESLRGEFGRLGIRVTTLIPGSTATDMQQTVSASMNRTVDMATLMQPEDVAAVVALCAGLPENVEVPEIVMRPMPPLPAPSSSRAT